METFLRMPQLVKLTGLTKITIHRMVKTGQFPKPAKISPKLVGWPVSEIEAWVQQRLDARRAA